MDYFIIKSQDPRGRGIFDSRSGRDASQERFPLAQRQYSSHPSLQARFQQAQHSQSNRYQQIREQEHVSEVTPWLRATGYHSHLAGLPTAELPLSYHLPNGAEEGELTFICQSVERLLERAHGVLGSSQGREERQLSRLGAKLLNIFRRVEMCQDPIKPLQNKDSKANYFRTWQKLACYFLRVSRDGCLCTGEGGRPPFRATKEQEERFQEVWVCTEEIANRQRQGEGSEGEQE